MIRIALSIKWFNYPLIPQSHLKNKCSVIRRAYDGTPYSIYYLSLVVFKKKEKRVNIAKYSVFH